MELGLWSSREFRGCGTVPSNATPHIILIDGRSGAGKTTLADEIAESLGATVVHLDDVYQGWGGLVEGRNRVIDDVIRPIRSGNTGHLVTWDWVRSAPGVGRSVAPAEIVIVEGCGISTPESRRLVDTCIWVDAPAEVRVARVAQRDGIATLEHFEAWERDVETHVADNDPIATATVVVTR